MNHYAWGALLYGEKYINGAIALYYNLKYLNSKYNLVLIIDEDLDQKHFDLFDSIGIKYYKRKMKTSSVTQEPTRFSKIINYFQLWDLVEYDKICILDLDIILLKNLDYIFDEYNQYNLVVPDIYQQYRRTFNFKSSTAWHAIFVLMTPQEGYWNYIYNTYKNTDLSEEQILYAENSDESKIKIWDRNIEEYYYHDIYNEKYWNRYKLTLDTIPEYLETFITNWWSSRDPNNCCYCCYCGGRKDLVNILILSEKLQKINSKYPLVVILKEYNNLIQNALKKANIYYYVVPGYTNHSLLIFKILKQYYKVVFLDSSMIYINKNPDFLFDFPDGSAAVLHANYSPEHQQMCDDLILVFEPRNHYEHYFFIHNKQEYPEPSAPFISYLWFHTRTNPDYQITDNYFNLSSDEIIESPLVLMVNNRKIINSDFQKQIDNEINMIYEKFAL